LGPKPLSHSSTSIGRGGARPGAWIIRAGAPSISTVSPANRPRSRATYPNSSFSVSARCPIALWAVNPIPKQGRNRPADRRVIAAIDDAIAISVRSDGTSTAVPRPMLEVRVAASARWTNGSSQSGAES